MRDPKKIKVFDMILKGALRPHPFLEGIINRTRDELRASEDGYIHEYMTLHARVEPDMARQDRVCTVSCTCYLTLDVCIT